MRFSGKTHIGLRALYDMAFHCQGRQARAREIAARQGVPIRYLEEALQDLRKAGLIEAHRGPRGGYVMARPPEAITVADVVEALDTTPLASSSASASARGRAQDPRGARPARRARAGGVAQAAAAPQVDALSLVWSDIEARVAALLGETTIADLVARAESAGATRVGAGGEPQMYFI